MPSQAMKPKFKREYVLARGVPSWGPMDIFLLMYKFPLGPAIRLKKYTGIDPSTEYQLILRRVK